MVKVFLDANILFSAAYREQAGLAKLWQLKRVKLVSSDYAMMEAERNLRDSDQLQRLKVFTHSLEIITSYNDSLIPTDITLSIKDRPILAAAIATKAEAIWAHDPHFKQQKKVKVFTNIDLLELSKKSSVD